MRVPPRHDLWVAGADVVCCFYQGGIPEGLSEWFTVELLSGEECFVIGLTHYADGAPIDAVDKAIPVCLAVTPMGWNWAFWLFQMLHLQVVHEVGV